jgi:glycosyltransferase involved in cell wall biosynthesis
MSDLLLNYSFLPTRITGLGTYALSVAPAFEVFSPIYLAPRALNIRGARFKQSPKGIASDLGPRAHVARLAWTEGCLPFYRKKRETLIFSPLPEAPLCSGRSVVVAHDLIPLRVEGVSRNVKLYFRHYVTRTLRAAEYIICNSEATRSDVIEILGIDEKKITAIPLGVDTAIYNPSKDSPKSNYLIYVGRHDKYKNIHVALRCFAAARLPADVRFKVVGPFHAIETPQLRALCVELGIESRVDFIDYVPLSELVELIRRAACLVHLSGYEGFGLTVLEAMACGTAVISSKDRAITEASCGAALSVDVADLSAASHLMERVVDDAAFRQKAETAGLEVAGKMTWDLCRERTQSMLSKLL